MSPLDTPKYPSSGKIILLPALPPFALISPFPGHFCVWMRLRPRIQWLHRLLCLEMFSITGSGSLVTILRSNPSLVANYTPLITIFLRAEPASFVSISVGSIHTVNTSSGPAIIALPTTNPISTQMQAPYQISGHIRKAPMPPAGGGIISAPPECHGGSNIGIPNIDVLFTVPTPPACFPDPRGTAFEEYSANGYYSSNVPSNYPYNIEPVKHEDPDPNVTDDDTDCACGVTDDDINQGRQFILGIIDDAPSLQQVIAADANQNGTVSTADLLLMSICMSGNNNAAFKPWRFVTKADYNNYNVHPINPITVPILASSITTASITSNLSNQDFYGIKLGDIVEQDCTECGDQDLFAPSNEDRTIVSAKDLFFEDVALEAGKEYLVPVRSNATSGLVEYSLELAFDPAYFDILRVERGDLSETYANYKVKSEGTAKVLKYIWFSMQPGGENLNEQASLFYLRIQAKKNANSLHGLIWQKRSERYNNLFFADGAERGKWSLQVEPIPPTGFAARLIGVNPAQTSTEIAVCMPYASDMLISTIDMNGRQATHQKVAASAGWNNITLDNLPTMPGTYVLRILTEFGQKSIRLIKQ